MSESYQEVIGPHHAALAGWLDYCINGTGGANGIGEQTIRHAAERGECPATADAELATMAMRLDIRRILAGRELAGPLPQNWLELGRFKSDYWRDARLVGVGHGARPGNELKDYFRIGYDIAVEDILSDIEVTYAPTSLPRLLLRRIECYRQTDGLRPNLATAARQVIGAFGAALPSIRSAALGMYYAGDGLIEAGTKAMAQFLTAPNSLDETPIIAGAPPLHLHMDDIGGIMTVCKLQQRSYSAAEVALANRLLENPLLQNTLLVFHMQLVSVVRNFLQTYPDRLNYSLETISEICVPSGAGDAFRLLPNPKLLNVIANNIIPAAARVLAAKGLPLSEFNSGHLREAIILARELGVFQTQIGNFGHRNVQTDSAEQTVVFERVCPALAVFTRQMLSWLPYLYDRQLASQRHF
ncbi:MAG TPA: hypothetical protein VLE99_06545 [Candidatus Saccharimonadales bacterium]|nr:hypothetical protein [Candidatus Saccharimonadales bacterium]